MQDSALGCELAESAQYCSSYSLPYSYFFIQSQFISLCGQETSQVQLMVFGGMLPEERGIKFTQDYSSSFAVKKPNTV